MKKIWNLAEYWRFRNLSDASGMDRKNDNFMVVRAFEGVDRWNLAYTFSFWCCIGWTGLEHGFTLFCCMLLQYAAHCCKMQKNVENTSNHLAHYVSCLNIKKLLLTNHHKWRKKEKSRFDSCKLALDRKIVNTGESILVKRSGAIFHNLQTIQSNM